MARLALIFGVLSSTAALACPACGGPLPGDQSAYLAMTIFLSLLPLAFIGGVVFWVAKKAREHDDAQP